MLAGLRKGSKGNAAAAAAAVDAVAGAGALYQLKLCCWRG